MASTGTCGTRSTPPSSCSRWGCIQWPTIATLLMWPVLAVTYFRLARREEAELLTRFGERYHAYAAVTPRFLPRIRPLTGRIDAVPGMPG